MTVAAPGTVLTGTDGTPLRINISVVPGAIIIENNTAMPVGRIVWTAQVMS